MAGEKVMEQTGSDELCERLEQLAQAIESQVEAINGCRQPWRKWLRQLLRLTSFWWRIS